MDDPGYSDYNDPRLQPPAGYFHDPTPAETYELCAHRYACARMLRNSTYYDKGYSDEETAACLGCGDCDEFDE